MGGGVVNVQGWGLYYKRDRDHLHDVGCSISMFNVHLNPR